MVCEPELNNFTASMVADNQLNRGLSRTTASVVTEFDFANGLAGS